jgi:nitrogen fixation protein FixH
VANDSDQSSRKAARAWVWPAIIVTLLGLHVALWLGFTYIAVRDPSFAVEPDSYMRSLQWDVTAAQMRHNRELGWSVELETEPAAAIRGDRRFACRIVDRDGKPVGGASVALEAFHHARGNDRQRIQLIEEKEGVYAARPILRKGGTWECRLTVKRGAETFTYTGDHEVRAAGGPTSWQP